MSRKLLFLAVLAVFASSFVLAKKKEKFLPAFVLNAKTVLVLIQPGAKEPLSEPDSNLKAQKAVEEALMRWGRFRIVMDTDSADLVITVQRGGKDRITPTVSGGPIDTRPVAVDKTDSQVRIGVQQGTPPDAPQAPEPGPNDDRVHLGTQLNLADDILCVYQGSLKYPLNNSPVWRYSAKDSLLPPDVDAVTEFRKALEQSEKAAAQKAPQPAPKTNP